MRRALDGPAVTPSLRDTLLLRERALQATTVGVVISDLRLPDNPVVWVNAAFTTTTGYTAEQAIGRNCRFLQGPETDQTQVDVMRRAVREQRASMVTLLNYRADGTTFWNSVSTAPVCDVDGDVIGFIGIQVDVTEQVQVQQEREARLTREAAAGPHSPVVDETLVLLSRVNEALDSGDVNAMTAALAAQLVPAFADNCAIDLLPPSAAAGDMSQLQRVAVASTRLPDPDVGDPSLLARVLRTSRPVSVVDHFDGAGRHSSAGDSDAEGLLVVPLRGRDRTLGALTLVSAVQSRLYTEAHLAIALDIGRRAGLAIENAQLLETQLETVEVLRGTLVPALPTIDGLELAAAVADDRGWFEVWPDRAGDAWIALGPLPLDGSDRSATTAELAVASRTQRTVHDRVEHGADPAVAIEGLTGLWLGRLSTDGTLTYAGGGCVEVELHRHDGTMQTLPEHGDPTPLCTGDALKLSSPGARQPDGSRDADPTATLIVRRAAPMTV